MQDNNLNERLWTRHQKRVETGARRHLDAKKRMEDVYGEGGVKLTQREKAELYLQAALDPMGQQMSEILMRRQQANKVGPTAVPRDWFLWDISNWAKHQEGRLMPEEQAP
jgi:hypothetical protein